MPLPSQCLPMQCPCNSIHNISCLLSLSSKSVYNDSRNLSKRGCFSTCGYPGGQEATPQLTDPSVSSTMAWICDSHISFSNSLSCSALTVFVSFRHLRAYASSRALSVAEQLVLSPCTFWDEASTESSLELWTMDYTMLRWRREHSMWNCVNGLPELKYFNYLFILTS